jgi:hypothetical protein
MLANTGFVRLATQLMTPYNAGYNSEIAQPI